MQKLIHHISVGYLVLLILIKMFAMPLVCFEYKVNKEYISANLCENRSKPQIQCFGQCQLKKDLTSTSEHSDAGSSHSSSKTVSVDFFEETSSFTLLSFAPITTSFASFSYTIALPGYSNSIFHPPAIA